MAVIYRISTIFEMEEYQFIREENVPNKSDVTVNFEQASLTWGFKVKSETSKKGPADPEEEKKLEQ